MPPGAAGYKTINQEAYKREILAQNTLQPGKSKAKSLRF
jgi:hypothetical protein